MESVRGGQHCTHILYHRRCKGIVCRVIPYSRQIDPLNCLQPEKVAPEIGFKRLVLTTKITHAHDPIQDCLRVSRGFRFFSDRNRNLFIATFCGRVKHDRKSAMHTRTSKSHYCWSINSHFS